MTIFELGREMKICLNLMHLERALIDTSPTCAQRAHVTIASKASRKQPRAHQPAELAQIGHDYAITPSTDFLKRPEMKSRKMMRQLKGSDA